MNHHFLLWFFSLSRETEQSTVLRKNYRYKMMMMMALMAMVVQWGYQYSRQKMTLDESSERKNKTENRLFLPQSIKKYVTKSQKIWLTYYAHYQTETQDWMPMFVICSTIEDTYLTLIVHTTASSYIHLNPLLWGASVSILLLLSKKRDSFHCSVKKKGKRIYSL